MTLKRILEGRPLGHPLHSLLVHLPLGMWLFAAILDVVSFTQGVDWARVGASWFLLIGTAVALVAAVTGFNDWLDIRREHPAQNPALWHMALNLGATVLFALDTLLHFTYREDALNVGRINGLIMGLSIVAYLLTIVGGYIGGLLVYDNGIAVGRHRRATELPQLTLHQPRKGTTEGPLAPGAGLPAEFHPVVPEAALQEGQTLRVEIEGTVLTLAKAQGEIFAVQEFCTHRCGPLSEGSIEGGDIRCSWHNSCFELRTGKVTRGPAKVDLKVYQIRVSDGIVHVRVAPGPAQEAAPIAREPESRMSERRNPSEAQPQRENARQESPRRTPTE